MTQFILACQDGDTGGISDRPGDMSDPFHTLFGVAGLSLLRSHRGEDCLKHLSSLTPVNPVFCMAQETIDKLELQPMRLRLFGLVAGDHTGDNVTPTTD